MRTALSIVPALFALFAPAALAQNTFVNWESAHVHPLDLSADGTKLYAVNTADARLLVYDITGALERIWEVVRFLNRHVEVSAPWQLAKDEARADELDRVLYGLADGIRAVTVALAAYMPPTADRILDALGQPRDLGWEQVAYGRTVEATGIEAAVPLFPRLDAPTAAA